MASLSMKRYDNFCNFFEVLKKADFNLAKEDEIYRTGVIGQFQLTFELAWKALRYVLNLHGVDLVKTGSSLEILNRLCIWIFN